MGQPQGTEPLTCGLGANSGNVEALLSCVSFCLTVSVRVGLNEDLKGSCCYHKFGGLRRRASVVSCACSLFLSVCLSFSFGTHTQRSQCEHTRE